MCNNVAVILECFLSSVVTSHPRRVKIKTKMGPSSLRRRLASIPLPPIFLFLPILLLSPFHAASHGLAEKRRLSLVIQQRKKLMEELKAMRSKTQQAQGSARDKPFRLYATRLWPLWLSRRCLPERCDYDARTLFLERDSICVRRSLLR